MQWCFSQVKGTLDEDLTEGKNLPKLVHQSKVPMRKDFCILFLKLNWHGTEILLHCIAFQRTSSLPLNLIMMVSYLQPETREEEL